MKKTSAPKKSTPRKMPAKPRSTILLLAQPQVSLFLIRGEAYLFRVREAKYINPETIKALQDYQWIKEGASILGITEYLVTDQGRTAAIQIEEDMRGYYQLGLPLPEVEVEVEQEMEQELATP